MPDAPRHSPRHYSRAAFGPAAFAPPLAAGIRPPTNTAPRRRLRSGQVSQGVRQRRSLATNAQASRGRPQPSLPAPDGQVGDRLASAASSQALTINPPLASIDV